MKKIAVFLLFFIIIKNSHATVPADIPAQYKRIIALIRANKAKELSKLIVYPLKRENPLKNIANAEAFIAYFPMMFDDAFKKKLALYNDTDVFEHNGEYGLVGGSFDGDIWLNDAGMVTAINYSSKREADLKKQLTKDVQNKLYPGVAHWDQNIYVLKSTNLLIRIDVVGKNIRYASWSKGKATSQKPDLVLNNGAAQPQGSQGGWTYSFKNGDWTYVIEDVQMCEDNRPEQCGIFLRLSLKGEEKSSVKLTEIK